MTAIAAVARQLAHTAARPRRLVAVGLLAVLAVGVGLRAHRAEHPSHFLAADERAYGRLADDLAEGSYGDPAIKHPFHWAPGTPAAFAVARRIDQPLGATGPPHSAAPTPFYWAQVVIGVGTILAAFALATLLATPAAGLLAATATALYPPLVNATGDVVSEPLGALTLTVALAFAVRAWRVTSLASWAAAGIAFAAAILVRADLLIIPEVVGAAIAVALLRPRRARARMLGAFAGAVILVLAPWCAFASARAGHFVPVTDAGASTLFVATYLPGDGTMFGLKRTALADQARRTHPQAAHLPDSQLRAEWVLDAVARPERGESRDHELRQDSLSNLRRYALGDPLDFAAMNLRKLGRMWLDYDRGTTHHQRSWLLALHLTLSALALASALWGLMRTHRRTLALVLAVLATATLVNAFFVAEPRHNLRLMPALIAAGAAGLVIGRRPQSSLAGRT